MQSKARVPLRQGLKVKVRKLKFLQSRLALQTFREESHDDTKTGFKIRDVKLLHKQ